MLNKKQTLTILILPFLLLIVSCKSFQSTQTETYPNKPDKKDFKAKLGYEVEKLVYFNTDINHDETPGFIIGILVNDSLYTFDYGTEAKNLDRRITSTTGFEVGGITKVFTASLVQVLVDQNKISLDNTIAELWNFDNPPAHAQLTTVGDLLSHTAGLPRLPNGFGLHQSSPSNPYSNFSKEAIVETYTTFADSYSTDKEYNYSEYNYGLLEILIEKKLGLPFCDILDQYLLQPLGLQHTQTASAQKGLHLAKGYNRIGKPVSSWDFKAFSASASLQTSMDDLLTFLEHQIDLKPHPYNRSFQKIQDPIATIDTKNDAKVALGWHILQPKNYHTVLSHSGYTAGHRAYIGAVKETKTAVVVLSNSEVEMNSIGLQILRHINNYWKLN